MAAVETILADLGPVVQGNNVLLFVVLILLFVIGYKLLQTVIRIGLVALMSGVFLVVLNMVDVGPAVSVERFILFMVLGTGLFIFYSTLATAVSVLDGVYSLLSKTLRWAFKPRKKHKRKHRLRKLGGKLRKTGDNKQDSSKTESSKEKEIVLGELDEE